MQSKLVEPSLAETGLQWLQWEGKVFICLFLPFFSSVLFSTAVIKQSVTRDIGDPRVEVKGPIVKAYAAFMGRKKYIAYS